MLCGAMNLILGKGLVTMTCLMVVTEARVGNLCLGLVMVVVGPEMCSEARFMVLGSLPGGSMTWYWGCWTCHGVQVMIWLVAG